MKKQPSTPLLVPLVAAIRRQSFFLTLLLATDVGAQTSQTVWRMASLYNAGTYEADFTEQFARSVDLATQNQLKVNIETTHAGTPLEELLKRLEGADLNAIALNLEDLEFLPISLARTHRIPFAVTDQNSADIYVSSILSPLRQLLSDRGLRPLTLFPGLPFGMFVAKGKPLNSVKDLSALRVLVNDPATELFAKQLGANFRDPTQAEADTNVLPVDGIDVLFKTPRELLDIENLTDWGDFYDIRSGFPIHLILVNENRFQSLTKDVRDGLNFSAWATAAAARRELQKRTQSDITALSESGVNVFATSSRFKTEMWRVAEQSWSSWVKGADKRIVRGLDLYKYRRHKPLTTVTVDILYGSNRAQDEENNGVIPDTSDRAETNTYGTISIELPVRGSPDQPGSEETNIAPSGDATKQPKSTVNAAITAEEFRKSIEDSTRPETMIYVHGWTTTLDEAAISAARLAHDLKWRGPIAIYSWATPRLSFQDAGGVAIFLGGLFGGTQRVYNVGKSRVSDSTSQLRQFLRNLCSEPPCSIEFAAAHSMGNDLLLRTLAADNPIRISKMIFAAPDVGVASFEDLTKSVRSQTQHMTLYGSRNDWALKLSRYANDAGRAGDAQHRFTSVDVVDASEVDAGALGHTPFDAVEVITDLRQILRGLQSPNDRDDLVPIPRSSPERWQLISPY